MDRRAFIASVSGSILAAPLTIRAQQSGTVRHLGVLLAGRRDGSLAPRFLPKTLRELRYVPYDRALWALRTWLDSWSGIGHVAVGMARQSYDLQLTRYDERGWRATFYTTGMEHSPTSATGTAWERTPWHATQRAAWAVEEAE